MHSLQFCIFKLFKNKHLNYLFSQMNKKQKFDHQI